MPTKPTIIEMDMGKLEDTLRRAETVLNQEDYARLKTLAESYAYLAELVGDKNTSIARLRKLLFGAKTEKTAAVIGERNDSQPPPMQASCGLQKAMRTLRCRRSQQPTRKKPQKSRQKGMAATGPTPTRAP